MNSNRIAIIGTAIVTAIIIAVLLLGHLSFDSSAIPQPPRPVTPLMELEEEYVDILNSPLHGPSDPAAANAPERSDGARDVGNPDGTDLSNEGIAAHTTNTVSEQASAVQQRPRPNRPAGPSQDEIERERARRRAQQGVTDAFSGTGNASAQGNTDTGQAGNPEGTGIDVNGTGSGEVGGGWNMPHYRKVRSTMTGSIILRVIIDAAGNPVRVEQTGGEAPAAANSALVNACISEVRAHRFTRNDSTPPPRSTASIIYRFR